MAQSKNRLGRSLGGLISSGGVAQAKRSEDNTTSKPKQRQNLSHLHPKVRV